MGYNAFSLQNIFLKLRFKETILSQYNTTLTHMLYFFITLVEPRRRKYRPEYTKRSETMILGPFCDSCQVDYTLACTYYVAAEEK